jgi:DNA-binding transcriptional LysR family regulator
MDTLTLSVFRDVAHKLSFAAVAKERGATPSSISRMIAALEADLQVRLLHRTTRKMVLTEAGVLFLRHATRILDAAEEARDQARGARSRPEGLVRLSASTAFGEHVLVPLLADFRRLHPGIQLDLHLSDDNLDLAAHGLDLAIRLGNRLDGDFISTRLFATRYRVCAAPEYLEEAPPLREPGDLPLHRCLFFTLPDFRTCWRFRSADGQISEVEVGGDFAMSSAGSLLAAARTGLGPALLADWLIRQDLENGALVDVFPEHEVTATAFETAAWLIYPSREYVPGRVRAVREFLRSALPCQQEVRIRAAEIE